MMKQWTRYSGWILAPLSALVVFGGCSRKQDAALPGDSKTVTSKEVASISQQNEETWTCPMHPQIRKTGPGTCPICGMTLVKVAAASEAPGAQTDQSAEAIHAEHLSAVPDGHASFKLSRERQQMIGVRYGTVEKKPVFKRIEAAGRVAFDPELYTAQSEYIEALRQRERVRDSTLAEVKHSAERMVESAKLRLKVLGLSDQQIANITASGAVGSSLIVPKPGETFWIYAEVYEMDLSSVTPGIEATISGGSLGGRELQGKVVSVDRVINPATRTAKVRILVPNARSLLRPEAYVDVSIRAPLGEQVVVPFDAVFDTGKEAWVFVARDDGTFEPRSLNIRFRADDDVAVESGVKPGEKIVTSANFLIDSESRLKGVMNAQSAAASGAGAASKAPSCPQGQHWDVPMGMCMPDAGK